MEIKTEVKTESQDIRVSSSAEYPNSPVEPAERANLLGEPTTTTPVTYPYPLDADEMDLDVKSDTDGTEKPSALYRRPADLGEGESSDNDGGDEEEEEGEEDEEDEEDNGILCPKTATLAKHHNLHILQITNLVPILSPMPMKLTTTPSPPHPPSQLPARPQPQVQAAASQPPWFLPHPSPPKPPSSTKPCATPNSAISAKKRASKKFVKKGKVRRSLRICVLGCRF